MWKKSCKHHPSSAKKPHQFSAAKESLHSCAAKLPTKQPDYSQLDSFPVLPSNSTRLSTDQAATASRPQKASPPSVAPGFGELPSARNLCLADRPVQVGASPQSTGPFFRRQRSGRLSEDL